MEVLVTGATGFLGGCLARLLAAQGHQVRTLQSRLADTAHLAQAVHGTEIVYHCAGASTDWAPWSTFHAANIQGVQNILDAARANPALRRFLHVSTTDIYGYPHTPCSEDTPGHDTGLPYNRSKLQGEALVWNAARAGLPTTIIRPATIFGPHGKIFVTEIAQLLRLRAMAVIDHGRAPGGFIYVENAAQAIIDAANSPNTLGQAYNLSDGTNISWRTYVDALADALRYPRPWIDLPAAAAFPLAHSLEAACRFFGKPPLTRHAVYLLSRNQEYPIAKAQRDFGFVPRISFESGIAASVQWLHQS